VSADAKQAETLEASFSTLVLSIGSSAAIALGLAPDPTNNETHVNKPVARFNIDLLLMLQEKTKSNLTDDEKDFLNRLVSDLQMHFIQK
jgi:hypothetical protein